MYTAASSASVAFNMLHVKCGGRIKQQQTCPTCNEVLDRASLVKGYEFSKDQYVQFTEDELKKLEGEASQSIDIAEFVPLEQVDPIYFEKTYFLGPDKGGDKAYRLLCDAMLQTKRVALAQFVMRGKESLVLVRPSQGGLMLHTMYFADEVRDFAEIEKGEGASVKTGELELALRLIQELTADKFQPERYHDDYRERVLTAVDQKVEGKEVTTTGPAVQRTQVIDLMDALKKSLEGRTEPTKAEKAQAKKQPAKAKRAVATKEKKAASK
jgi:DNA end-binding protein Ku